MFWSGVEVPQGVSSESLLQSLGVRFKKAPSNITVVVIGGGLSGLISADALKSLGFDVIVLEGRGHRYGGRIDTKTNLVSGLWAEAGPEFLSPAHRLLIWHINNMGLDLLETSGMEESPFTPIVAGGSLDCTFLSKEVLIVKKALTQRSLMHEFSPNFNGGEIEALDDDTLWSLVEELDLSENTEKFLQAHFEFENGIDPRRIGLLPYLVLVKSHGSGFFENLEKYRLNGGMSRLTSILEKRLSGLIQRGAKINRIECQDGLSRCILEKSTGELEQRVIPGHEIILTIPPRLWIGGKLFGVTLTSELIPQMGDAIKVLIKVPSGFHIPTGILPSAFLERDSLVQAVWEGGIGDVKSKRILTIMCGGSSAERMLKMRKDELIIQIISEISKFCPEFSDLGLSEQEFYFKDWGRIKLTGCGYGCPGPYEFTDYRPELLRLTPNNLHLSGEWESSEMWGYMEGAVRSALNAVLKICFKHGAYIPKILQDLMVVSK